MSVSPNQPRLVFIATLLLCTLLFGCEKRVEHQAREIIGPSPSFPTSAPVVISLQTFSRHQTNFSIQDPKLCEVILAALGPAQEVGMHKCAPTGRMTVTLANQDSLRLEILHGHDPSNVEYVYQRKYYMGPGTNFFKALKTAGVDLKLLQ
ncbi:MAG TPA: hypothetical protein VGH19_02295 [Verrucomicrobiae bacterium]